MMKRTVPPISGMTIARPPVFTPPRSAYQPPTSPMPPAQPPPGALSGEAAEVHFRRALEASERRTNAALGGINENIQQILGRLEGRPPLDAPGTGLGQIAGAKGDVAAAIKAGLCIPYFLAIQIFVPAGCRGKSLPGQVIVPATGPLFISRVEAFAQISEQSAEAAEYPLSLITPPPPADCDPNLFDPRDAQGTWEADCGNVVFPTIDARGMFIPVGSECSGLLCCGLESCCYTKTDPDETVHKFRGRVPIVLRDHIDILGGTVELFTNSCGWQFSPFPIEVLACGGWDITAEKQDCLGVCGYVDCAAILSAHFTPTNAPLFDTFLYVVYEGFVVVTCGPSCGLLTKPAG